MSKEYKTTFNYILTHVVLPQSFYSNVDFFYETVLPNPDNMQIFMQKAVMHAGAMAHGKPDVEPSYQIENFKMGIYGDVFEKSVIVVEIPKYEKDPDCVAVAFPVMREYAGYYTCELATDFIRNKSIYMLGEWVPNGESFTHKNYGWIEINDANEFWLRVAEIAYPADSVKGIDEEPDHISKTIGYAAKGWECYKNDELKNALFYFDQVLTLENGNPFYFQCMSCIQRALGKNDAADYFMLRAKLIDMILEKKETDNDEETEKSKRELEEVLEFDPREPLVQDNVNFDIIQNEKGEVQLRIVTPKGRSFANTCITKSADKSLVELFYSGEENVLFRRRMDQFFFLENINPNIREQLCGIDKILVAELNSLTEEDKYNDVYEMPVRFLNDKGCFDTIGTVRENSYCLFASLAALVRKRIKAGEKISDIISKDDLPTLAAILAKEEDYQLLDKYISEGLPINDRTSWWFKNWQPSPLFYITLSGVWLSMKEPEKMLRHLVDLGADPNLASIEGDTPLGNQCFSNGSTEIMKALLNVGADPNIDTVSTENTIKPLILILCPADYNTETHEFIPVSSGNVERAKLLIQAGADVNVKYDTGIKPLGLVFTYTTGNDRHDLIKLLLSKGACVETTLSDIEENAAMDSPEYYYALYEFYAGLMIDELTKWADKEKADYYLKKSAEEGYLPAMEQEPETDAPYHGYV